MQQELTSLQPQLIKTSAETAALMQKIEVDTVEVEAKKEVDIVLLSQHTHFAINGITYFKLMNFFHTMLDLAGYIL